MIHDFLAGVDADLLAYIRATVDNDQAIMQAICWQTVEPAGNETYASASP